MFRYCFGRILANDPRIPPPQLHRLMGHDSVRTTMTRVHSRPGDIANSQAGKDLGRVSVPSQATGARRTARAKAVNSNSQSGGQAEKVALVFR